MCSSFLPTPKKLLVVIGWVPQSMFQTISFKWNPLQHVECIARTSSFVWVALSYMVPCWAGTAVMLPSDQAANTAAAVPAEAQVCLSGWRPSEEKHLQLVQFCFPAVHDVLCEYPTFLSSVPKGNLPVISLATLEESLNLYLQLTACSRPCHTGTHAVV